MSEHEREGQKDASSKAIRSDDVTAANNSSNQSDVESEELPHLADIDSSEPAVENDSPTAGFDLVETFGAEDMVDGPKLQKPVPNKDLQAGDISSPIEAQISRHDGYTVIETQWISMTDGIRLAARMWMPDHAHNQKTGAVLEFLPYRRRDGTAARDESTYPTFARAGIVGIRVDQRGTGDSEGLAEDEYSPRELADAVEIIDWACKQRWSNGRVGMMGISWGGFNSLQVAAIAPPQLRAIITLSSTVDRYNDDIHYKNGCLLAANLYWSTQMLSWNSRPPDPVVVGNKWQEMWLNRLAQQEFFAETWFGHQRRDDYWKHGSVNESYNSIKCAVMAIGGWADGYHNAPPALAKYLKCPVLAINGPWIHKYPHIASPEPRMDFLDDATKFWQKWLLNEQNNQTDQPRYRAYLNKSVRPGKFQNRNDGHWIGLTQWPSQQIQRQTMFLSDGGKMSKNAGPQTKLSISSPMDTGTTCGEFFVVQPDSQLPGDQRLDNASSLNFESDPISQPVEIVGRPELTLHFAADQVQGNLIVRLLDIHPDRLSHRVSIGVLNIAHRYSNEHPEPMPVNSFESVTISLNECGHCFQLGHRVAVAISTAYWPMILPPPVKLTATVATGSNSYLILPIHEPGKDRVDVPEPEDNHPLPEYPRLAPDLCRRWVERDLTSNLVRYHIIEDSGAVQHPENGIISQEVRREVWSIEPNNPLSASASLHFTAIRRRGNWNTRSEARTTFRVDEENFYLVAHIQVFQNDKTVHEKHWERSIARDLM